MRNSKSAGFTLVELLVVISIIALLLSILMPSLQSARRQAKNILCKSNLRQIVLSALFYAEDNSGRFIYKEYGTSTRPMVFWLAGTAAKYDYRVFFDGYLADFKIKEQGVWTPGYDYAPKVAYCPFTKSTNWGYDGETWPAYPGAAWSPFVFSYNYYNLGDYKNMRNVASWQSASEMPKDVTSKPSTPLFGDLMEYRDLGGSSGYWREANHFRRGFREYVYPSEEDPEGLNAACVDGSVRGYRHDTETEIFWQTSGLGIEKFWWGKP